MINLTATDLSEIPRLVDWLTERGWDGSTKHGKKGGSRPVEVESIDFALLTPEEDDVYDEDEVFIDCRSIDVDGRCYETRLIFFEEYQHRTRRTELEVLCDCECEEMDLCRHGRAVLEKLREIAVGQHKEPKVSLAVTRAQVKDWFYTLQNAVHDSPAPAKASVQKPYTKFLAYCIEQDSYGYGRTNFQLITRVADTVKDSVSMGVNPVLPDPAKPHKCMTEEDVMICLKLQQWQRQRNQWLTTCTPIHGEGWDSILEMIAATGRLYIEKTKTADTMGGKTQHIPLVIGPDMSVDATWQKTDTGMFKPVLSLPHADVRLLATSPLQYVDRLEGFIGLVKSNLPGKVLLAWPLGPQVPAEVLNEVGKGLVELSATVPLPVPGEVPAETMRGVKPQPVLKISEVRIGIYQKRHIGGVLQFRYEGRDFYPLHDKAPHESTWFEGENRFVLARDAAAEAKFAEDLIDQGLVPLHKVYAASDLTEKTRHSVVLDMPSMELRVWLEFLDGPLVHSLREAGWTIEADPKLNLSIHDIGDFFPEIEEDAQRGIDWFRFDVTGEFDGKKISLIPHIARAIRDDWCAFYGDPETRPSSLLLPCDDPSDGHIRFPAERFLAMVDQVRHLFHGLGGSNGPVPMDRMHAAGVAAALGVDSSATTRALAELGRNLRDIHGIDPVAVPEMIQAQLRPYQLDGFRWLQFLARHGLHGILADDMGLGKTLQTLAHLAAEVAHAAGRPSLVVAPTSVVPNWAAEAKKFAPKLKILVLHGSDRGDHFEDIAKADVVFTTYPLLARDFEILRNQDWHVLVLDEAQYIKNPKALSSQCACKLRSAHRVCLSGTPMENHLGELWSLMRFLMPGFLADEKTFNSFLRKPIERERSVDAQLALNRRVSPLILRRTKDQVATELPEKTTLLHYIDLNGRQTDLYESVRAAMDERVRDAILEKGLAKSHIIVLDALLKLRQICCHPQLLKSESAQRVTESAKLEYLSQDLLPTLLEEGRRILLFSQFTSMLELIEEHLAKEQIPYLKLTGQTRERAELVKKFQSGEFPVFLISLKAGGTGLNLTAADTVIHYDPWWNPAAENQATDRAHRMGQTKPVFVHKLVCRGTIEERILDLQKNKSALIEALLSEETTKLKIDQDTLQHLFAPIG